MDNDTLATELLHEIKSSARRWFVAFCIMVGLEIATIIGFMWYISLPTETSTEVQQDTEGSSNNSFIGGDNSGTTNN